MSRGSAAVLSVVLAAMLFATASDVPAAPANTGALRGALMVSRIRDHLTALQTIAARSGGTRAVGTPGYQGSVDYVRERLVAAGYQVQLQPFRVSYFSEPVGPSMTRVRPTSRGYAPGAELRTMTFSGSGDVTASVVAVDLTLPPAPAPGSTSGCEPNDFAGFPGGAIALMQRGSCPFAQKARNAKSAGASAMLIMNEGQPGRREAVGGTLERPGLDLPALGVSFEVGAELAGQPGTTARIVTRTVSETRETVNVIADGADGRADRVVLVGAHLDSVPAGPGINDDGTGVATVLEIADQLARLPMRPRNRVRFAFWGAEELGLLGSTHYVGQLTPAQRAEIAVNLNFDMLGSPNFVRFVYDGDGSAGNPPGPPGSGAVERVFTDYFSALGLPVEPTPFDGRSDYGPFAAAGIPAGGVFSGAEGVKTPAQAARYGGSAGQPFDRCYHQACDTRDNISDTALDQLSDAAAAAVLRFMLATPNPRQAH